MNTKKIIGVSLAAVFTVVMLTSPMMAEAITGLTKGSIEFDDGEIEKVVFSVRPGTIKTSGQDFGGYGVLTTSDSLLVVTSHKGVFDSKAQGSPGGTFKVCTPAEVSAGLCGPEWHTHLANLGQDLTNTCLPTNPFNVPLEVKSLTFEEPSDDVNVKKKKIVVEEVEDGKYTESVSGTLDMQFTLGPYAGALVQFDLVGREDAVPNLHVCVENVVPLAVDATGDDDDSDSDSSDGSHSDSSDGSQSNSSEDSHSDSSED